MCFISFQNTTCENSNAMSRLPKMIEKIDQRKQRRYNGPAEACRSGADPQGGPFTYPGEGVSIRWALVFQLVLAYHLARAFPKLAADCRKFQKNDVKDYQGIKIEVRPTTPESQKAE